jgi:hypothetical protein
MNQRIKELVVQAGFSETYGLQEKERLSKLAELIVQEMLKTCAEHPAWYGRMIADEIKQNFGVKE